MTTGESAPRRGFVLAGGLGTRMGSPKGGKGAVEVGGRPLIEYALGALREAGIEPAIVAKAGSDLPDLDGVEIVTEADSPRHPLTGVVAALESLPEGESAILLGCDVPLVTAKLIGSLAATPAPACARSGGFGSWGRLQPLIAHYRQSDLEHFRKGLAEETSLIATTMRLQPALVELPIIGTDPWRNPVDAAYNVNSQRDIPVVEMFLDAA